MSSTTTSFAKEGLGFPNKTNAAAEVDAQVAVLRNERRLTGSAAAFLTPDSAAEERGAPLLLLDRLEAGLIMRTVQKTARMVPALEMKDLRFMVLLFLFKIKQCNSLIVNKNNNTMNLKSFISSAGTILAVFCTVLMMSPASSLSSSSNGAPRSSAALSGVKNAAAEPVSRLSFLKTATCASTSAAAFVLFGNPSPSLAKDVVVDGFCDECRKDPSRPRCKELCGFYTILPIDMDICDECRKDPTNPRCRDIDCAYPFKKDK
jgi:hypothetical protein